MKQGELLEYFPGAKRSGKGYKAPCPAHDDRNPSLSISEGGDGRTLLKCMAGCSTEAVLKAAGLRFGDLFPDGVPKAKARRKGSPMLDTPENGRPPEKRIVATYDYTDADGELLFQVVRYDPKDFRQRRPDGRGGYIWNLEGIKTVLYRETEVREAVRAGKTVYKTEGEKDADRLHSLGLTATTAPMGAGHWEDTYTQALKCAHVVILPDNDVPGRKHVQAVAKALQGTAASVKVVELPGLGEGGDVSDWIDAGGTAGKLEALAQAAPEWAPSPAEDDDDDEAPTPSWPEPLREEAYHGLAGDIVRAIDPHTEADPAALLLQLLIAVGNVVGRGPHFMAEADRHGTNLFGAMVGQTAKGRKGTSWGHVRRLLGGIDEGWERDRVQSGLSSGEGLIWAVRDPIEKEEPIKETKGDRKGEVRDYQTIIIDPGIEDKRLLAIEPELASVLKVLGREGNTLSALVRQAWDTGTLRSLTKNAPAKATGAHTSIVGHITVDELTRYLETTEAANGFANRFIWFCVRRSKMLPDGDRIDTVNFEPIKKRLQAAIEWGQDEREFRRDEAAREIWHRVYPALSDGRPGLLGAVLGRAEAQVMRLAMIYALLDCSEVISAPHLTAALAVWRYAEESAKYIFGESLGDSQADAILKALREAGEDGMTRTEIRRKVFMDHATSGEVARALSTLDGAGKVRKERDKSGKGRPVERWYALREVA